MWEAFLQHASGDRSSLRQSPRHTMAPHAPGTWQVAARWRGNQLPRCRRFSTAFQRSHWPVAESSFYESSHFTDWQLTDRRIDHLIASQQKKHWMLVTDPGAISTSRLERRTRLKLHSMVVPFAQRLHLRVLNCEITSGT